MAGPLNTSPVAVETRPGIKTTEFWVMVLALAVTTVQEAVGIFHITDARVLLVQSFVVGAYTLSRGLAKLGVPNVVPATPSITTTSSAPTSETVLSVGGTEVGRTGGTP
jgi:hypothetical protein